MDGQLNRKIDRDGQLNRKIYGGLDRWVDGQLNRRIDRWKDS